MIKSMTGYGGGLFVVDGREFFLEARSVNHRFLDFKIRLPDRSLSLEGRIRSAIKERFSRGYFSVSVCPAGDLSGDLDLNIPLSKSCYNTLNKLREALDVEEEVTISHLLSFKELLINRYSPGNLDCDAFKEALLKALSQLDEMRAEEGENLADDINTRLSALEEMAVRVEAMSSVVTEKYRERLNARLSHMADLHVDEARLLTEVTLLAERSNITEEVVRAKSHIDLFRRFMTSEDPVGRRMDFLCQELQRELNTIASKANDTEISHVVVDMKGELEKIREQVQNIE